MSTNPDLLRPLLKAFDFRTLFVERLGWDRYQGKPLIVPVSETDYTLTGVAHKRGMVVYECGPGPDGAIPDSPARRRIDKEVMKTSYEHLLVFIDGAKTMQCWQWVKRQRGERTVFRQHSYHKDQPGDLLIQKLQAIRFTLEEEEQLTQPEVPGRVRQAFDVDRITRRFYDLFQREHSAFLGFIDGIAVQGDQEWYASVMLNRLMFVYFIQKQGFLANDPDYLRNRLKLVQKQRGGGQFHTFYRHFLLRLFHEGLGQPEARRQPGLDALLGKVPYLNGGIFDLHELERAHTAIHIPDEAFERIFNFFDAYQWHLDDRPLRADNEINPDVLGYIFEKYINQKEMGAYYTKEDITGYIARNTILPFLLDAAAKKCPAAFRPGGPVWRLLRDDPDCYLYEAVRHGVDEPLPEAIAAGVSDTARRDAWNRPASASFNLPTETWREHVARRQRCHELRRKLKAGEVHRVDDLITCNLDVVQFAEDVLDTCDDPDLLRAFWDALQKVSVLDPTCGSGAFLFAALNILAPLYDACLERMQFFLDELERSGTPHRPEEFADFREALDQVAGHPSPNYFIIKSIILQNLYGVDIMKEAVEICKLRLFLKLVAQVQRVDQLEPLPDIDFNIRTGNTLVGFATLADVQKTLRDRLNFTPQVVERILADAQRADEAFQNFRRLQTEYGKEALDFSEAKAGLRRRLEQLRDQLDRYLADEYDVDQDNEKAYEKWHESHQPFHWFAEFYNIMAGGGFDAIIGNPPYLELKEVEYTPLGFACFESKAIHAMCIEQGLGLLGTQGSMSMIVPLALPSTQRMQVVQELLETGRTTYYSNFSWRPGKLFDTVNRALTIFVVVPATDPQTFATGYQKWSSEDRERLMERIAYIQVARNRPAFWVPKLQSALEQGILAKCLAVSTTVQDFVGKTPHRVYYRTDGGLYWKVFTDFAPAFVANGVAGHSTRETWITLGKAEYIHSMIAALSSNVFWWWYTVTSNCRHLNPYDIYNFPIPSVVLADSAVRRLGSAYLDDIRHNSTMLVRRQKQTGRTETQSFKIQLSKPLIDEIDRVLARHYGFTNEELDFLINYDIKYRMGHDGGDGEQEE